MFDFQSFFRFVRHWVFGMPWTRRRVLISFGFVFFVPLELIIHAALWLDEIIFSRYRKQQVIEPVFIVGLPRSGTTWLHRLLARDERRFTSMSMWEILFAPSIVQRRVVRGLAVIDRFLGRPLDRARMAMERRWAERNVMHGVSLTAPEEDDYLLVHAWSALTVWLSSGLLDEAQPYTRFDSAMPQPRRRRIMKFYRRCVQRYLYEVSRGQAPPRRHSNVAARGSASTQPHRHEVSRGQGSPQRDLQEASCAPASPQRHYLAKNPALCPKLDSLLGEFPDAKIIYLVRNPLDVIPSYLSMMDFSWKAVGVSISRTALCEYLMAMAACWYRYPLDRLSREAPGRYAIVNYDELMSAPEEVISGLYAGFGWEMDAGFRRVLQESAASATQFHSRHHYSVQQFGLTSDRIIEEFKEVFEKFGFSTQSEPQRESAGHAGANDEKSQGAAKSTTAVPAEVHPQVSVLEEQASCAHDSQSKAQASSLRDSQLQEQASSATGSQGGAGMGQV